MDEVLVIGGGGFVGTRLVRMLSENGNRVRIFSRSAGVSEAPKPELQYIQGQVAHKESVFAAVQGAKVVFDLSLGARGSRAEMERDYVEGTRNVAQACCHFGVRRLVYASTTATLDFGLNKTINESEGVLKCPEAISGFYHLGKIAAEQILLEMHAAQQLPAVILRPGIIMGRGGKLTHDGIGVWRDSNRCLVPGKGTYPLPLVLVEDVARAFFLAMDAPCIEGKTFNLVGDVRPSSDEMLRYIRQRSHRNFQLHKRSLCRSYAIDTAKWIVKRAIGKPDKRPLWHNYKASQLMTQFDCSAAKRFLGWQPVDDLETFLREAVDPHLRPVPAGDLRNQRSVANPRLFRSM